MHVLHIGLSKVRGGIETCVLNYARSLHENGIFFDYVDIYGDGLAIENEVADLGGHIYTLPNYKYHYSKSQKRLEQIIKECGCDVVHIHLLSAASLFAVQAAQKSSAHIVIHSHNSDTVGFVRPLLHKINRKRMKKVPCLRLACSQEAGKWMFSDSEFSVLPNGIHVNQFRYNNEFRKEKRKELGIEKEDLVLGFVGRLEVQKNPLYLIKILATLKNELTHTKLVIVGEGSLKEQMIEYARQLDISNDIYFVGSQNNANVWYSVFDAFILPSIFEGFGMVALEAQSSGLPTFVSNYVSQEVMLSPLVKRCALTDNAEEWTKTILSTEFDITNREFYADYFLHSNYSVLRSAVNLEKIYKTTALYSQSK